MENLGIFHEDLVYFRAIGNFLRPFGIFCGNWYIFSRFGILDQEKSGTLIKDLNHARTQGPVMQ
jgi:hypothetical protein